MIDSTLRWYAIYTKSRAEKKVAEMLEKISVHVYLPLQKTLKQWSDRRKFVQEPLFRSYVFVKVNNKDYLKVLSVPGAVGYVSIGGEKIAIPDCQIEAVKAYLGELILKEEINYFEDGDKVEVAYGSLKGLRGELLVSKNINKLTVLIDAVNQNITLTLPGHLLKKIKK
jgi:transcriptional antiterminator RfaH